MGVRTNVDLALEIGRENNLSKLVFDGSLQQLLDTLEHVESGTITLEASETNFSVPFGDVAAARIVYFEATGPVRITPGGTSAAQAIVTGVGGSYPTGFAGGEELVLEITGTAVTVAFAAGDQSLAAVINRINAAAAIAGIAGAGGVPTTIARTNGGAQLRLLSPTSGLAASVVISADSDASVLTALGLTAATTNGTDAGAGQTPITLLVPADTSGSDDAEDVRAFLFASLSCPSITLENLDDTNDVVVTYAVVGDLVTDPPTGC